MESIPKSSNLHWTYGPFEAGSDLEQGDFLVSTPELRSVLSSAHPWFSADKYLGFAVTTQSCDLVRRKGKQADAQYINISAVRSLAQVMTKLLSTIARPVDGRSLFRGSIRGTAKDLLKRIFDQNEQKLGLFYYHPDAQIELGEPSVSFLRVSIALRGEHYESLVASRRGRLSAEFRGKFGWLTGNLYSRAASPDWADHPGGANAMADLIERHLSDRISNASPAWIDDVLVEAGKQAQVDFHSLEREELVQRCESLRPKPAIERVADLILKELDSTFNPVAIRVAKLRKIHKLLVAEARDVVVSDGLGTTIETRLRQAGRGPLPEQEAQLRLLAGELVPLICGDSKDESLLARLEKRLQAALAEVDGVRELDTDLRLSFQNQLRNNGKLRALLSE